MENVVKEESKNKNLIIGVLVFVIVLLLAALIYFVFIKKDNTSEPVKPQDNQQVDKMLSNEEALNVAKEKLNSALNFWGDFERDDDKDSIGDWFYYYDTLDNFKNRFYSIYSKQLVSKDVFEECSATLPIDINGKCQTNLVDGLSEDVASYAIKDNKVYVQNYCTVGDGFTTLKGDYEVKSITNDKIVVKYVLTQGDEDPTVKDNHDEEIVLVKEDNNWKIQKVTLIGVCNGFYEVGK